MESTESVTMYFMDLISSFKRDLNIPYSYREFIYQYCCLFGVACQGRIIEINHHFNYLTLMRPELKSHLEELKPLIIEMGKIAAPLNDFRNVPFAIGLSFGERADIHCKQDENYMKLYVKLKSKFRMELITNPETF